MLKRFGFISRRLLYFADAGGRRLSVLGAAGCTTSQVQWSVLGKDTERTAVIILLAADGLMTKTEMFLANPCG
jgi:hypothetical protein